MVVTGWLDVRRAPGHRAVPAGLLVLPDKVRGAAAGTCPVSRRLCLSLCVGLVKRQESSSIVSRIQMSKHQNIESRGTISPSGDQFFMLFVSGV